MNNLKNKIFFFLVALFLPFTFVLGAEVNISQTASSLNVGDLFSIVLRVDSGGVSINNAEGVLNFPNDKLEAISVSKADSVFSLWVEEPKYSNSEGKISFNGGIPTPGYLGSAGTILKVTFTSKKSGQANLFLSNVAVRANDGNGTDVFSGNLKNAIVSISEPIKDDTSLDTLKQPEILKLVDLEIYSDTHPNQDLWYSNSRPELKWFLPKDAQSVQLVIDESKDVSPKVNYKPAISSKYLDNLSDGVWYFKARYKNELGWSKTSSFTINIDTTKPVIDNYDFAYDQTKEAVVFSVSAKDELSGVSYYAYSIDNGKEEILDISGGSKVENYVVNVSRPGVHKIHLSAVDFAGNKEIISGTFSVPISTSDQVLFRVYSFDVTLKIAFLGLLIFSIIALVFALFAWYRLISRRHFKGVPLSLIKREIHNGFLIFKDKLEGNLAILDKAKSKRRLTREEEEVYKNISKNLKYLEEYVDKSVDHLK